MPTPIWPAEIRAGKLYLDRRAEFDAWLGARRNGRYDLTIKAHRDRRSNPANAYYWGVVLAIIAEHVGDDPDELHKDLARKFLTVNPDSEFPRVRSTARLDSAEFARYVDDVRRFAAQFWGLSIPGPNEIEGE